MPDDEGLREELAEQAWGVLVAAAEDGTTNWNVVAHAIVGNQLPVVERYAAQRAAEALREAARAEMDHSNGAAAGRLAFAADRHDETGPGR